MPVVVHNKLVRDRIPEIIAASGRLPKTQTLDEAQVREALIAKINEEASELQSASARIAVLSELADLLEILQALAREHGVSWKAVTETADTKRAQRGGFERRLLLLYVEGEPYDGE